MAASVSGLVSGLDTAAIIAQLMKLEAAPQNRLKTQQSTEKSALSALQALNSTVAALKTQAETLAKPATWQAMKGTVSGTGVTATVGAGAAASSFTVTVRSHAANHQVGFANAVALGDRVVSGSSITITHDGVAYDVPTAGGTLKELVDGINAKTADTGVTAVAVQAAGGYRLLVQSTTTGAASEFSLAGLDTAVLGAATVQQGKDAEISLGAVTATSATNTFTDLVPGVTLKVDPAAAIGSTATVTVARDSDSVKESVKALVDKVNSLLTTLDAQTKPNGVLSREPSARALRSDVLETVFGDGTTTMATVGIQTDRYGKLVFDEKVFDEAYAADPAGVAARFTTGTTDGWAARVASVAEDASDGIDGTITSAITGRQSTIDRLQDSIDAWDLRLELRQATLTRQYTAMETALSRLTSQGNWLAGQLGSLPSNNS